MMRRICRFLSCILFLLITISCQKKSEEKISLAGQWQFSLDPNNLGIKQKWYTKTEFKDLLFLPGSLQEQGYGYEVDLKTKWTGEIVDKSYFTSEKYLKYRKEKNIKVPFWLNPTKHYVGVAWYRKEIEIPKDWEDKKIMLCLERPHIETTLYIDGREIGTRNSLSVKHEYLLPNLKPGQHALFLRINNQLVVDVGINSHSVTDHTQTNWNGVIGAIYLEAKALVTIERVLVYPDIQKKEVQIISFITNYSDETKEVDLSFFAKNKKELFKKELKSNRIHPGKKIIRTTLALGEKPLLWSEYSPNLYHLKVCLKGDKGNSIKKTNFGLRKLSKTKHRFTINNVPIFLRGTLECCIFPLTGYPSMQKMYWEKICKQIKAYGLNHIRFHSWCPPEVAFEVADEQGLYLQIESGSWANTSTTLGDNKAIDQWIYEESERILNTYGNHPSFCFMAYGNEPGGKNQKTYLTQLINYWHSKDKRHLYTGAAGWPYIETADYYCNAAPRIQGWGEQLNSVINKEIPNTLYDFKELIARTPMPYVSHEIGQWCAFPNFNEIEKYTGVLKPKNFEIFQETLTENKLGRMAEKFLFASGRLQTLCYKADIEAALRTKDFAGFQLLDLHDFPGQGTALVGVLDAFWDEKGYVDAKEYSSFCNRTVPLVRLPKMTWKNDEMLTIPIEVAHFEQQKIDKAQIKWQIREKKKGTVLKEGCFIADLPITNCISVGTIRCQFPQLLQATQVELVVSIPIAKAQNSWDLWIYPNVEIESEDIYITSEWDHKTIDILKDGGKVLLSIPFGKVASNKGGDVAVGFSSIFWNTAWTRGQAPHTLGVYCEPSHPALQLFPTECHSNYQWHELVSHVNALQLDGLSKDLIPIIYLIDDWFENRRLALAFEANIGKGQLIVTSIDFTTTLKEQLATHQLKYSFIEYMKSKRFNPKVFLSLQEIKSFIKEKK